MGALVRVVASSGQGISHILGGPSKRMTSGSAAAVWRTRWGMPTPWRTMPYTSLSAHWQCEQQALTAIVMTLRRSVKQSSTSFCIMQLKKRPSYHVAVEVSICDIQLDPINMLQMMSGRICSESSHDTMLLACQPMLLAMLQVSFADAGSTPQIISFSHGSMISGTFSPVGHSTKMTPALASSSTHTFLLKAQPELQQYIKMEYMGSATGATGEVLMQ